MDAARFGAALSRLSIGAKLLLAPGVTVLLLVILAITAALGLHRQQAALTSIYQVRFANLRGVGETAQATAEAHAGMYRLLSQISADFPEDQIKASGAALQARIDDIGARLGKMAAGADIGADERQGFAAAQKLLGDYRKVIGDAVDVASVQASMATAYMSKAESKFDELGKAFSSLRGLEQRLSDEAYGGASTLGVVMALILVGVLAASIGLSLAFPRDGEREG